ncbi:hypothetical protein ACFE04_020025 [Oxalis oulophora]
MNNNMEISADTNDKLVEVLELLGLTDYQPPNDNSFQFSEGMSNMPNGHGMDLLEPPTPISETINCKLELEALTKQQRKRIVDRKYRSRQKVIRQMSEKYLSNLIDQNKVLIEENKVLTAEKEVLTKQNKVLTSEKEKVMKMQETEKKQLLQKVETLEYDKQVLTMQLSALSFSMITRRAELVDRDDV